jgi:hypothetical protein
MSDLHKKLCANIIFGLGDIKQTMMALDSLEKLGFDALTLEKFKAAYAAQGATYDITDFSHTHEYYYHLFIYASQED